MLRMMRLGWFFSALLLTACDEPSAPQAGADAGREYVAAAMCAPGCEPTLESHLTSGPAWAACFDGCNWCSCSTEGPVDCTARHCSPDAGVDR